MHNGIVENFAILRRDLEAVGVEMRSDTDSEVVAHLLARSFATGPTAGDLPASMAAVCQSLEGAFTIVAAHADVPSMLVAARRNSPLVIGVGVGEMFVASDVSAFIDHTRMAIELGQDQLVVITPDNYDISSFSGGDPDFRQFTVDWDMTAAEKDGYPTFMDKEIFEQPAAIERTLLGHFDGSRITLDEQRLGEDELRDIDKVFVVACGTAFHAGLVAKYAIEHWARLPVEVELASEFRYRDPVLDRCTLLSPSVSRARRPTPWKPCDTPDSRAPASWQSVTPMARRFLGNPMPCCTPALDRKSGSPRPRPSWPR